MTTLPSFTLTLAPASTVAERLPLTKMELFAGLPERDLSLLDLRLPAVRWGRGEETPELLTRPDHLYLIREGRMALLERTGPGQTLMISLLDPGAIYSTLGNAGAPKASVLDDAAVTPLPGRVVEALITRYPRLGLNLAQMLSERVANLCETVAMVSEMRVEDRLRARLHQLADRFGVAARDGVRLSLDLTHAQWASLIGASREAVTTAFGKLRTQGITIDGRSITIPWEIIREREDQVAGKQYDADPEFAMAVA
jgi:CRP/FNR family transcriptional regulator, cyclic AMP receptor protein